MHGTSIEIIIIAKILWELGDQTKSAISLLCFMSINTLFYYLDNTKPIFVMFEIPFPT